VINGHICGGVGWGVWQCAASVNVVAERSAERSAERRRRRIRSWR